MFNARIFNGILIFQNDVSRSHQQNIFKFKTTSAVAKMNFKHRYVRRTEIIDQKIFTYILQSSDTNYCRRMGDARSLGTVFTSLLIRFT